MFETTSANTKNVKTDRFDDGYDLKTVKVAGRGELLIPATMHLLNPDQEGQKLFLYRVWAFDPLIPEGPSSFEECVEGLGMCHPYGWFSDYGDLWRLGRHDAPMFLARFNDATEDYKAMTLALVKAMDETVPAGTQWTFAWSPCDLLWRATPVGTAPFMITSRGAEGSN